MKNKTQRLFSMVLAPACALLLLPASPARAEVGVVCGEFSTTPTGPYEIRAIIEDGSPVGAVWRSYSPPGSDRIILNADGEVNGDGRPSSLFSIVSGLPMVAWARSSAGGYDVVISHFFAGAWSQPTVLAEDATASEPADPHVAVNPSNGSVYALYWTNDANPTVMYRKRRPICHPGARRFRYRIPASWRYVLRASSTRVSCT
jgi:hypothetical protein